MGIPAQDIELECTACKATLLPGQLKWKSGDSYTCTCGNDRFRTYSS